MIARVWSARATKPNADLYLKHFSHAVLPELRKLDGYVSSNVLTRANDDVVEIQVTTIWRSFESINAFAAPDREAAVVAPEAVAVLIDFDHRVKHYEVAVAA
jgi:heme-degrading monooxygenase HmoA